MTLKRKLASSQGRSESVWKTYSKKSSVSAKSPTPALLPVGSGSFLFSSLNELTHFSRDHLHSPNRTKGFDSDTITAVALRGDKRVVAVGSFSGKIRVSLLCPFF